jgi:uncharacterized damage-inducible protein DinB
MDAAFRTILWQQFGAAIDMLENALLACPEKLWGDRSQKPEFWYTVYHTLFWLDFHLADSAEGFTPPAPFTLDELDPAGLLPERVYSKDELHNYLQHDRQKCRALIEALTDEKARQRRTFISREFSVLELLLYSMRHVQHDAAQLNLMLRQATDSVPPWVAKAKSK